MKMLPGPAQSEKYIRMGVVLASSKLLTTFDAIGTRLAIGGY